MIQISVINESTGIDDKSVQAMLQAFQTQWNRDLAPAWCLEQAQFTWSAKGDKPPAGAWWLVFLDDSDQAQALAYHDLTNDGLPIAKVFVKTIQGAGVSLSVGATHEICEMAVDPTINLSAQDSGGAFWAYEVCDPVEDDKLGYMIDGVLVSNFVTPAWFGFAHAEGQLDYKKKVGKPFEVLAGGYAQTFDPSKGWTQVAPSGSKSWRHGPTPIPGSRRERRARKRTQWEKSKRAFK